MRPTISNTLITLMIILLSSQNMPAQSIFSVNGFCIGAPQHEGVQQFVDFVEQELVPLGINTIVLRVDFNYAYQSRPELQDENPLTKDDIKKIVFVCKKYQIDLIPQINLLGHQTWASKTNKLLEVYPEFDETPHVEMPEKYEWPNEDGLYCKSYCPNHPDVHKVVFDLIDEILEVFEAKAFHAGLDEVFYIADSKCPRCNGMDPAAVFAEEVTRISNHLQIKGARLWMWGDRLIDASTADIGMWEASMNNTARAVDMIPKSVVICDWHYEKALPTPAFFALKGFDVIACPWRKPEVAKAQVKMMYDFKNNSTPITSEKYLGLMQTIWSPASSFIEEFYEPVNTDGEGSQSACLKTMTQTIKNLEK